MICVSENTVCAKERRNLQWLVSVPRIRKLRLSLLRYFVVYLVPSGQFPGWPLTFGHTFLPHYLKFMQPEASGLKMEAGGASETSLSRRQIT
jgi:hypothetical protein